MQSRPLVRLLSALCGLSIACAGEPPSEPVLPGHPLLVSSTPPSPSNARSLETVQLEGAGAAPGDSVLVWTAAGCDGEPLATVTADAEGRFTVSAPVAENASSSFSVRAEAEGRLSPCSPAFVFVSDTEAPEAPELFGTLPAGADPLQVRVFGRAEALSLVDVFTDAGCTERAHTDSVQASAEGAFAVLVQAAPNAITTFFARASDAAGNVSDCSAPVEYVVGQQPPSAEAAVAELAGAIEKGYLLRSDEVRVAWSGFIGELEISAYEVALLASNQCARRAEAYAIETTATAEEALLLTGLSLPEHQPVVACVRALDRAGKVSDWVFTGSLIVDSRPPQAVALSPLPGEQDAEMEEVVSGQFDEPLLDLVFRLDGPAGEISGELSQHHSGFAFTPHRSLQPETTYVATAEYRDDAGHLGLTTWTFRTKELPWAMLPSAPIGPGASGASAFDDDGNLYVAWVERDWLPDWTDMVNVGRAARFDRASMSWSTPVELFEYLGLAFPRTFALGRADGALLVLAENSTLENPAAVIHTVEWTAGVMEQKAPASVGGPLVGHPIALVTGPDGTPHLVSALFDNPSNVFDADIVVNRFVDGSWTEESQVLVDTTGHHMQSIHVFEADDGIVITWQDYPRNASSWGSIFRLRGHGIEWVRDTVLTLDDNFYGTRTFVGRGGHTLVFTEVGPDVIALRRWDPVEEEWTDEESSSDITSLWEVRNALVLPDGSMHGAAWNRDGGGFKRLRLSPEGDWSSEVVQGIREADGLFLARLADGTLLEVWESWDEEDGEWFLVATVVERSPAGEWGPPLRLPLLVDGALHVTNRGDQAALLILGTVHGEDQSAIHTFVRR